LDNTFNSDIVFPNTVEVLPKYQKLFLNKMGIYSRIKSKLETIFMKIGLYK